MKNAIIFFAGQASCRNPRYFEYAKQQNLAIINIEMKEDKVLAKYEAAVQDENHPLNLVSESIFLDSYDDPKLIEKLEAISEIYNIKACVSLVEYFVLAAAHVCELFNLKGTGLQAAYISRDKALQRNYFYNSSPKCHLINTNDVIYDRICYPCIIKPIDMQGSFGVKKLNSKDEFDSYIINMDNNKFLVEEEIKGMEFSCESLVANGKIQFSGITEKITTDLFSDFFVEIAHLIPPKNLAKNDKRTILKTNAEIIEGLKIKNGIVHAEYKIKENSKNAILMEVAVRNPGDGIMNLYYLSYGKYLEDAIIDVALGKDMKFNKSSKTCGVAKQFFLNSDKEGIYKGIEYSPRYKNIPCIEYDEKKYILAEFLEHEDAIKYILLENIGRNKKRFMSNSFERIGSIIIAGESHEKIENIYTTFNKQLQYKIE